MANSTRRLADRRIFSLLVLLALSGLASAQTPESPEPGKLWIMYAAADDDYDARMIAWWGDGWDRFAATVARHIATVEATQNLRIDGIQVHHPWGRTVIDGKPQTMEFSQRVRCYEDYRKSGNKKLRLAMDDGAFVRAMNRISQRHRLMIYMGSPHQLTPSAGETKAQWVERAKQHYGPVLRIKPPVAIGMDATFGQPQSASPDNPLHFTGGADGAVAQLVRDLTNRGHEVFFESGILYNADWARELCSTYTTREQWWVVEKPMRHGNPRWGRWARPQLETGGTTMIQLVLTDKTDDQKRQAIGEQLRLGRDVVVPPPSLPGYPWRD